MEIIDLRWPWRSVRAIVAKQWKIGPCYWSLIGSRILAFKWHENHRPWMTLKATDKPVWLAILATAGFLFFKNFVKLVHTLQFITGAWQLVSGVCVLGEQTYATCWLNAVVICRHFLLLWGDFCWLDFYFVAGFWWGGSACVNYGTEAGWKHIWDSYY